MRTLTHQDTEGTAYGLFRKEESVKHRRSISFCAQHLDLLEELEESEDVEGDNRSAVVREAVEMLYQQIRGDSDA